jgi:hypothetical protein
MGHIRLEIHPGGKQLRTIREGITGVYDETQRLCAMLFDEQKYTQEDVVRWKQNQRIKGDIHRERHQTRLGYAIIQREVAEQKVWGTVAVPGEEDVDGIIIAEEAIRQAAHDFMESYQTIRYRHTADLWMDVRIIESVVLPGDMVIRDGEEEMTITKGSWWLGVHILSPVIWKEVMDGELQGFSLGGFIDESTDIE